MEIKYQFNKTSLQSLAKDLKVRVAALPTLHAKESALRAEVKGVKEKMAALQKRLDREIEEGKSATRLWSEFPHILYVREVKTRLPTLQA